MRWAGTMPAKVARRRSVLNTSKRSARTCARSACAKRWKRWSVSEKLGENREPMPGQFEVMIERNFSSAHQLRGYKGKCENLHGHNYRIEIYARGRELDNIGLLVDF